MIKRPMLIITITYIIGILMGLYLKINMALYFCIFLIIFFITYSIIRKIFANSFYKKYDRLIVLTDKINVKYVRKNIVILFICCVTFVISNISTQYKEYNFKNLYNGVNENVNYIGIIVSEEKESSYYYNYVVKIKCINNNEHGSKFNGTNILLRVKKNKKFESLKLEYGDLISGMGNFEEPEIRRNFKGYDYSQYLKTKNVYRICKSNLNDIKLIKRNAQSCIKMWINKLQNNLKEKLCELLPRESSSIAIALLLGDSNYIDDEQKNIFSNASLSHILAISGMHVTYVIMGISLLLKKYDKRKSKFFSIAFLIFFSQLTGSSPSVIRAVIMSCLMVISKLCYRKSDSLNNICIACLIILVINPYNILDLGFQLSFLGTLGIVLLNSKLVKLFSKLYECMNYKVQLYSNKLKKCNNLKSIKEEERLLTQSNINKKIETKKKLNEIVNIVLKKIKSILIISISANILIYPVLIYTFNSISITFLISNIIVTPIVIVMFFLGYITMIISVLSIKFSKVFAILLNFFIQVFNELAMIISNIPLTRFLTITPNLVIIVIYYFAVIYFTFFYKKKHNKTIIRLTSFSIIAVILINIILTNKTGLKLHFIDVGQGDSTLIQTHTGKSILIDGGGSETGDYDVGEKVLVPYLLDRGISEIDYIIFSHFDSDHCKGLFTVMENLNVKVAIISEQSKASSNYEYFTKLANEKKIKVLKVKAGDKLTIDKNTYFEILWPSNNLIGENPLNNNSIVCKFHYRNLSLLFTGDIEEKAEDMLINMYGDKLNSDIVKVAHHGSKTSSTQGFLELVKPKIALIGVGKNNSFGHPSEVVIERFELLKCAIYRTDKDGEISISIDNKGRMNIKTCINKN